MISAALKKGTKMSFWVDRRPGKSALDAVGVRRQRCWMHDWVLEFDVKGCLTRSITGCFSNACGDGCRTGVSSIFSGGS